MSDDTETALEGAQSSTVPPSSRGRRQGERLTATQRREAQETFLAVFAQAANVSAAASAAGVERPTVRRWRASDKAFQARFEDAEERANDRLRGEAWRRGVEGVEEPAVNSGGLVYEWDPVLDEQGNPVLDERGKPRYQRGRQVTVRKYSDTVLLKLMAARMPEFREKQQVEHSGSLNVNVLAEKADARFRTFLAAASAGPVLGRPDGPAED